MSNNSKNLGTQNLIKELERRMYVLQAEKTELREQMIIDLVKDLDDFVEEEKEKIINAFNQGFREGEGETMVADTKKDISEYDDAINYYNETFGEVWIR